MSFRFTSRRLILSIVHRWFKSHTWAAPKQKKKKVSCQNHSPFVFNTLNVGVFFPVSRCHIHFENFALKLDYTEAEHNNSTTKKHHIKHKLRNSFPIWSYLFKCLWKSWQVCSYTCQLLMIPRQVGWVLILASQTR